MLGCLLFTGQRWASLEDEKAALRYNRREAHECGNRFNSSISSSRWSTGSASPPRLASACPPIVDGAFFANDGETVRPVKFGDSQRNEMPTRALGQSARCDVTVAVSPHVP